jgi:hypothetical protein
MISPVYIWKTAYHTTYSFDCHTQLDQLSKILSEELVGNLFHRDQHPAMWLRVPSWGW